MAVHLIHGFNVSDGGRGSIGKLAPWMGPDYVLYDQGWTFLLRLRFNNDDVIEAILPQVHEGDFLVSHSNGGLISWRLAWLLHEKGVRLGGVVCIQPALRRDTLWPEDLHVLCFYNPGDWIVELGRLWSRFASVANPWRDRHGWGSAGRHGFTSGQPLVDSVNTKRQPWPATGHSGFFKKPAVNFWGAVTEGWMDGVGSRQGLNGDK